MPNLRLVGVILKDGQDSLALIETPPQRQALYRVGDTVADARLEEIREDRAIVRYRGQEVVLRLATSPGANPSVATPPGRPAPPPVAPRLGEADSTARMRELARRLRDNPNDAEAGAELRRLRMEQLKAPVSARELAQSRAAPDVASAQPAEDGVRLMEVNEGGVLARLGLRPGDIVRSVNQRAIGPDHSLADALAEAASSTDSMQIEITRGGAQTTQEHRLVP
jgi:type II secretory pathway component PulC